MMTAHRNFSPFLLAMLVACGTSSPPIEEPRVEVEVEQVEEESPAPTSTASPRALGPAATFGDLVAAARALDDQLAGDNESDCVLRGSGESGTAWRLEADLAVAVRPLPAAPADLADVVEQRGRRVRVLSRWGPRGDHDNALVLTSFTMTPPVDGPALVVFITPRGVYLRLTEGDIAASDAGPFPLSRFAESLDRARPAGVDVFVSAAATTPLVRVRTVLGAIPADVTASLAVVLDANVQTPTASDPSDAGLCPDGLPETDAASGDVAMDRLRNALVPLTAAGAQCFQTSRAESATGGRMTLAIRLNAEGLENACVIADELSDPQLRECILRAVRALEFPAPTGTLDLQLPLVLRPEPRPTPQMICR